MPDDKEVERLAREYSGQQKECPNCYGVGFVEHECPEGCTHRIPCSRCLEFHRIRPALRSAMRIGEKRAYEDADEVVSVAQGKKYADPELMSDDIRRELQAKADSLKGE